MVDETAEGQCEGDENHENDAKTLNKHDKNTPLEFPEDIVVDLNGD
ncbi:hypothetical protein [Candidatus Phyllobacterium onerii]|nr:hypothetical protein [Phyllobacterium sp. IY22]